ANNTFLLVILGCLLLEKMNYKMTSPLSDLPIYKKAMDILMVSRSISTYIVQDLSYLDCDGNEDAHIYFSGDIIQQSESLAPQIEMAQAERFSERKYEHLDSIEKLLNRLQINCNRLENCKSNGRDYLPILKKELNKFNRLKRNWMLSL
ncbi:MAG: hypothetical protein AAF688_15730, partial [Bacteroidota bacterium]